MKKLLAPKETLHFPDYGDNCILANDMPNASINSSVPDDPILDCSQHLSEFRELSCEEVQSIIQKSAKKTTSLDSMPTSMVVVCLEELLPVIMRIENSSLSLGHFPSKCKEALVDPRLNKSGKDISFQNLRPVSNLHFVSKLSERAVFNQIHEHMMKFELYPFLQSAYRSGHSTETALLKVQNDILLNMDRQKVTLLVLLDLSAAFDTVDHQVLLKRQESSFGITGTALSWVRSYQLTDHSVFALRAVILRSLTWPLNRTQIQAKLKR